MQDGSLLRHLWTTDDRVVRAFLHSWFFSREGAQGALWRTRAMLFAMSIPLEQQRTMLAYARRVVGEWRRTATEALVYYDDDGDASVALPIKCSGDWVLLSDGAVHRLVRELPDDHSVAPLVTLALDERVVDLHAYTKRAGSGVVVVTASGSVHVFSYDGTALRHGVNDNDRLSLGCAISVHASAVKGVAYVVHETGAISRVTVFRDSLWFINAVLQVSDFAAVAVGASRDEVLVLSATTGTVQRITPDVEEKLELLDVKVYPTKSDEYIVALCTTRGGVFALTSNGTAYDQNITEVPEAPGNVVALYEASGECIFNDEHGTLHPSQQLLSHDSALTFSALGVVYGFVSLGSVFPSACIYTRDHGPVLINAPLYLDHRVLGARTLVDVQMASRISNVAAYKTALGKRAPRSALWLDAETRTVLTADDVTHFTPNTPGFVVRDSGRAIMLSSVAALNHTATWPVRFASGVTRATRDAHVRKEMALTAAGHVVFRAPGGTTMHIALANGERVCYLEPDADEVVSDEGRVYGVDYADVNPALAGAMNDEDDDNYDAYYDDETEGNVRFEFRGFSPTDYPNDQAMLEVSRGYALTEQGTVVSTHTNRVYRAAPLAPNDAYFVHVYTAPQMLGCAALTSDGHVVVIPDTPDEAPYYVRGATRRVSACRVLTLTRGGILPPSHVLVLLYADGTVGYARLLRAEAV